MILCLMMLTHREVRYTGGGGGGGGYTFYFYWCRMQYILVFGCSMQYTCTWSKWLDIYVQVPMESDIKEYHYTTLILMMYNPLDSV